MLIEQIYNLSDDKSQIGQTRRITDWDAAKRE